MKVSPNRVISTPGQPKSTTGKLLNAAGRNCSSRYLNTVIRFDTMTNRPPSRTHLAAAGCLAAKLFQNCIMQPPSSAAQTLFHLRIQHHILNRFIHHPHKTQNPEALQFHDNAVHHAHADGAIRHLCQGAKGHIVLE